METTTLQAKKYALVTGAASGMGRKYALRLAERGYALVVVDCQAELLEAAVDEIRRATKGEVKSLVQDLTADSAVEKLYAETEGQGLEIEVVVSNAGRLLFGGFASASEVDIESLLSLHCSVTTRLCHRFGARMRERGRGYLLLMSSTTARMPLPSIALYAATKRCIDTLGSALHDEWANDGVAVTVVCPGAVDTPFYALDEKMRRWLLRLGVMLTPDEVASRALRALFYKRKHLTPGWAAKLMVVLCVICPSWVIRQIVKIR
ncbi:MAG: SDR family NAD(P)-dependent oxidoreductase, partial [Alistipes sp.]|nr:SDR family NAD(P)-dependent oxidoreductase [Alistipes sp.]